MAVSLVQKSNWTNITDTYSSADNCIKSKSDLFCNKHDESKVTLLIHVIDGWIIEESNQPFKDSNIDENVNGGVKSLTENGKCNDDFVEVQEKEINTVQPNLEDKDELMSLLPTKCKYCGAELPERRAMWGKRFCSVSCGKRYSVKCSKKARKALQSMSTLKNDKKISYNESKSERTRKPENLNVSSREASPDSTKKNMLKYQDSESTLCFPPRDPLGFGLDVFDFEDELYDGIEPIQNYSFLPLVTWSVNQVSDYISTIPGCAQYVPVFEAEEIDGQALLLLKVEHMVHGMNIKVGPAIKIAATVRSIKLKYGIKTRSKYLSSP
ncbi:polyhomeotic-like protein 2 isoform X1 [Hydra vulgaris]|uniref:Polyhomeotic-like protein 2 isoform X1 n=1 Tax=Hydra vulgaris TaxID=6087 RepID=A0ABM4C3G5_HYDVU